ncbi:MAG: cytochrome c biogenesis protein ResB [Chromatiales bacterium]|nr:cytochrome c biogenesis protein ResB [Chromatiales bacterium]
MSFSLLTRAARLLASLKVAIPLLVVLTVATIVGSLFPEPDIFRSTWYLTLLGLQGISLLLVTILHIPSILKKKGRNALLGVITTHLGILVLIAGVIYGGFTGFRHQVKLIEGRATVVPGLPFVIHLDALQVEEYRQEDFPRMNLAALPKKQQDSHLTLLKNGEPLLSTVAAPGRPAQYEGITLLPSVSDTGWTFELIITDPIGRESTIAVLPWAPPMISLGERRIVTHGVQGAETREIEIFSMEDGEIVSLGFARSDQSLPVNGYQVALGPVKRYTSIQVYNRPQGPVLVLGSILMFAGLVWHFYFRHRDRRKERRTDNA